MPERRKTKIQIDRRKSDVPVRMFEQFKKEVMVNQNSAIREAIETYVNGGIRKLAANTLTKEDFQKYVDADTKWKEEQEKKTGPIVRSYDKTTDAWSIFVAILKFMGILGAAILAWQLIKSHFSSSL